MNGTVDKTQGGLKKGDLKKNSSGKIVSRKASEAAKKKWTANKAIQSWRKVLMATYADMKKQGKAGAKGLTEAMKVASKKYKAMKK
jgi:hypothetical protein